MAFMVMNYDNFFSFFFFLFQTDKELNFDVETAIKVASCIVVAL